MEKVESKCENGVKIEFKETPHYYKITAGSKTWYWNGDTGEFDGTSYQVAD